MKQVWQRLRSELVEIIEWSEAVPGAPSPEGDTLAWRFESGGEPGCSSVLRNGSQLIVREGQWAVFLDEGRIADAFGPGRHTLSTANLPLLTNLLCLPTGFESPFKAEVVFVATRLFSGLKWGTRQPLLLRDPELGPVRLRGFGSYSLRVNDPAWLVRELSGARGRVELSSLQDPLRSLIVSRLADVLGRSGCPVFDLSSRTEILGRDLRLALLEDVQQYGLEIPSLLIEALTLPPEVEAALVRRNVRMVEGEAAAGQPASLTCDTAGAASPLPAGSDTSAPTPILTPPDSVSTPEAGARGRDSPRPRRAPPPPPPLPVISTSSSSRAASSEEASPPPSDPQASVSDPTAAGPALQPYLRTTRTEPPEPSAEDSAARPATRPPKPAP